MTTAEKNLAEAQDALRRAEEDVQRCKNAESELKQVRAEGRRLTADLNKTIAAIRRADAARLEAEHEITHLNNAINAHAATEPSNFPSDADFATRKRKLQALTKSLDAAIARKQEAEKQASELRLHALHLDRELVRLRNTENQLASLAKGEVPAQDWRRQSHLSGVL
jgi:chromosome segregation ATPase